MKKAGREARLFPNPAVPEDRRLENWKERRALALPYFLVASRMAGAINKRNYLVNSVFSELFSL